MMNMAVASFGLTSLSLIPPTSTSTSTSYPFQRSTQERRVLCGALKARFGSSKGAAGVLERPAFDQSQFDPFTQVNLSISIIIGGNADAIRQILVDTMDSHLSKVPSFIFWEHMGFVNNSSNVTGGGDSGQLKDKKGIGNGDSYRFMLIDDFRHSDKLGR
ncbi:hypothetical protein Pint_22620 [Pistacia integerrima]|uniref:Uncharacterized protein n=1 Tax=Pistacia integerrima TaxID=434235 RepID=A0ACC0YK31_9ROSI|nr:hypothetical protein Pint_22620 [Pistacia integerrima]